MKSFVHLLLINRRTEDQLRTDQFKSFWLYVRFKPFISLMLCVLFCYKRDVLSDNLQLIIHICQLTRNLDRYVDTILT